MVCFRFIVFAHCDRVRDLREACWVVAAAVAAFRLAVREIAAVPINDSAAIYRDLLPPHEILAGCVLAAAAVVAEAARTELERHRRLL